MTVTEAGMRGRNDEAQLAFALARGRVTVTQDRDFLRLASRGVSHAGIVYTPQGARISTIVSGHAPDLQRALGRGDDGQRRVHLKAYGAASAAASTPMSASFS